MEDYKEETGIASIRSNPWKTATLLLGTLFIIFFVMSLMEEYKKVNENVVSNNTTEFSELEVCSFMSEMQIGTPAWFSDNSTLITRGYQQDVPVESLIGSKVHFMYHDGCSWCEKQVTEWGLEDWDRYVQAGLTHNCREVLE